MSLNTKQHDSFSDGKETRTYTIEAVDVPTAVLVLLKRDLDRIVKEARTAERLFKRGDRLEEK